MTIYLDNAATSYPKPPAVYEQMMACLKFAGANPGRAGHKLARAAQQILETTRFKLAQFINAPSPQQIILTFNATDALNMAIKGLLKPGDHAITSCLEHNSVLRPLQSLTSQNISTTLIKFDSQGFVDPQAIEAAIKPQTRLIALTSASNVLGTIQPIEVVSEIAHRHGCYFLVDAAQTLGVLPLDVQACQIDLLAASGHKALLGPPGTGLLYVREGLDLACWREGGTGGDSLSELQPAQMPFHLEAGTHNTSGIAGLGAAIDYINSITITAIRTHEMKLLTRLLAALVAMPGIQVYGSQAIEHRVGTVALSVSGYRADEVGIILDESFDIAVRSGLHCAPLVHKQLGTSPDGLVRVSIGPFNTEADIDMLVAALKELT